MKRIVFEDALGHKKISDLRFALFPVMAWYKWKYQLVWLKWYRTNWSGWGDNGNSVVELKFE